ncbi:ATP synthase F0 subunit B [bacterium]|nr:ATP synthase F0 subunit B [bacterium]MBD62421.1 ATP synthase F0 subunit B [bacterium]|tara:strand:- start:709 stop:1206 length:498 start_codon:yes stop_codon:yes gene_type:complete
MELITPKLGQLLVEAAAFGLVWWAFVKFLASPISKILEERKTKIKHDVDAAEKNRADMESLKQDYDKRMSNLEIEVNQKISEAISKGEAIVAEMTEKAELASEETKKKMQKEIDDMRERIRREIKKDAADLIVGVSEKFLTSKLNKEDEKLIEKLMEEVSSSLET